MRRSLLTLVFASVAFFASGAFQRADAQVGGTRGFGANTTAWQGNNAALVTQYGGLSVNDYTGHSPSTPYNGGTTNYPNRYTPPLNGGYSRSGFGPGYGYGNSQSFYPPGGVTVGPRASASNANNSNQGVTSGPKAR